MIPNFRNIALGIGWFAVLFIWDALDSLFYLRRATARIKTDETTVTQLKGAVLEYVASVATAYLVMGLLAGIMIHLVMHILHPSPPSRRRWAATGGILVVGATVLGIARQIITFPTLHGWFPWRRHWAEFAEPWWVDSVWALAAIAIVVVGWRRWSGASIAGFERPVLMSLVYAAAVTAVLQPLDADDAVDNEGFNVVLLGVDALRPDRLGHFGNPRNTSPHMDAVLAESVIFTQAFSQISRTYPAWTTTMTGAWPTTHGIRDNLPTDDRLVPSQALLPQVLQDSGYATGFATDDSRFSYMVPETGFQMIRQPTVGLQNFAISVNEPRFRAFHGLLHNRVGFTLLPVQAYNQAFGSSYRPEQFVEWTVDGLAELSRADRFFFAVHSCVLHVPGDRVYPWYRMFDQVGYKGKNRFRYSASGSSLVVNEIDNAKGKRAKRIAEQDLKIYDSGIRMADDLVGEVVAELKESGLWDNTLLILFSDHGEDIWEPDLPYKWWGPNHGFHVYGEGHTNVAFAIRFPDGHPGAQYAGTVVDEPIRLIDLAPTVADVLGIEWPNPVDGKSVMPLITGEPEAEPRTVYMETGLSEPRYWVKGHKKYPFKRVSKRYKLDPRSDQVHIRTEFLPHLIAAKDRALQIGKWKLIWHSMKRGLRVDLYDRETDPTNRIDRAEDHPEIVEELGRALLPFLAVDGIDPPPVETWVTKSRKAKLSDTRFRSRMERLGGTLPPGAQAKETGPVDTTAGSPAPSEASPPTP